MSAAAAAAARRGWGGRCPALEGRGGPVRPARRRRFHVRAGSIVSRPIRARGSRSLLARVSRQRVGHFLRAQAQAVRDPRTCPGPQATHAGRRRDADPEGRRQAHRPGAGGQRQGHDDPRPGGRTEHPRVPVGRDGRRRGHAGRGACRSWRGSTAAVSCCSPSTPTTPTTPRAVDCATRLGPSSCRRSAAAPRRQCSRLPTTTCWRPFVGCRPTLRSSAVTPVGSLSGVSRSGRRWRRRSACSSRTSVSRFPSCRSSSTPDHRRAVRRVDGRRRRRPAAEPAAAVMDGDARLRGQARSRPGPAY